MAVLEMSTAPEVSPAKPAVHVWGWKPAAHSWSSAATPLRNLMRVHAGPRYRQGLPPKNCKPALQTWTLLRNCPWARVMTYLEEPWSLGWEGTTTLQWSGLSAVVREEAQWTAWRNSTVSSESLCVLWERKTKWGQVRVPVGRVHGGGLLGYPGVKFHLKPEREEGFLFFFLWWWSWFFCYCKSRGKVSIITTWFYLFLGVQEEDRWGERYRMFLSSPERKHPMTHSWL